MKYLVLFAISLLSSSALWGQKIEEYHRIQEEGNEFSMNIAYHINDEEYSQAQEDINAILGQGVEDNIWTSTDKLAHQGFLVKMINGYVFVRAHDYTSDQSLKPILKKLDEALIKYKGNK